MRITHSFISPFLIIVTWVFITASPAMSGWDFKPSLSLAQSYDSNIYSREDNVEDYVTRVGADLSAIYSGPDVNMLLSYLGNANAYADHPELNVLTHDSRLNVDMGRWIQRHFRESSLSVSEKFTWSPEIKDSYADEEAGVSDQPGDSGLRTRRSDSYRNVFSVESGYPLSKRQDITIQYSNLLTRYSDPLLFDNEKDTISIGTNIRFVQDVFYGNTGVSRIDSGRGYFASYSVTGGVRHNFSPFSLLNAGAGMEIVELVTGGSTSVVSADIQFTERTRYVTFIAGYSRESNSSTGVSATPAVADLFYVNSGIRHSVNLSSNYGFNYSIHKSIRGSEVDTRSYNLSARVSYSFRPWLDGSAAVSHFEQSSETPASPEMDRQQITFQISIHP